MTDQEKLAEISKWENNGDTYPPAWITEAQARRIDDIGGLAPRVALADVADCDTADAVYDRCQELWARKIQKSLTPAD